MTDKQNFEKDINTPHKKHACDICGAYYCNGDDCRLYNEYTEKEQECEFSNLRIIQLQETLSQYETELDQLKAENEGLKEKIMYLEFEIDRLNG